MSDRTKLLKIIIDRQRKHVQGCAFINSMGVRRNFSSGCNVDILLIFFSLLTMQ